MDRSDFPFRATVTNTRWEGDTFVMETLDPSDDTDLIGEPGEPLRRRRDLATEEQQEVLDMMDG